MLIFPISLDTCKSRMLSLLTVQSTLYLAWAISTLTRNLIPQKCCPTEASPPPHPQGAKAPSTGYRGSPPFPLMGEGYTSSSSLLSIPGTNCSKRTKKMLIFFWRIKRKENLEQKKKMFHIYRLEEGGEVMGL